MTKIFTLIFTGLLVFSCTNNKDKLALVNNKGVDDYGVNYSIHCDSNQVTCDGKPSIQMILFDKFNRDSLKAIRLNPPDTFHLCCSFYARFIDSLKMYKLKFDSLKNARPFGGVRESTIAGASIGIGGVLTQPGVDSIFTVSIAVQPHSSRSMLAFRDTASLNVLMNKMDTLYRTCCLQ